MEVVSKTSNWNSIISGKTAFWGLPNTEDASDEGLWPVASDHLRELANLGNDGALNDDWGVGGIEETDLIWLWLLAVHGGLETDIDLDVFEEDNSDENKDGGENARKVWKVGAEDSFTKSAKFVLANDKEVEESDDSTFVFNTVTVLVLLEGEETPHDLFADVSADEEGSARANTVTIAKEFIKKNDNNTSGKKLSDDKDTTDNANFVDITIAAGKNVSNSLESSHNKTSELLSSVEESGRSWISWVAVEKAETRKKLKDHTR